MKHILKTCAAFFVATSLVLSVGSCKADDDDSEAVAVTSVELNKTSTSIGAGEKETLTATVKPDNATDKTVTWTSDKTEVATVENGVVTAVAKGTATITAKAGDKTATCSVTVTDARQSGSISYGTASVEKTTASSAFTNELTKTGDGTVTYASSDTGVATVIASTGEVTIVGEGTATITATVTDSDTYYYAKKTASYTLTVTAAAAKIVDLSTLTADTVVADGYTITGTLGGNYKITIADGATVTLKNVAITSLSEDATWAGINCPGNATLVIEETNTVESGNKFINDWPAIFIAEGKTLTIQGTGTLNATAHGYGAGIGGCNKYDREQEVYTNSGNIIINSGTIVAKCETNGAGIGCGSGGTSGTITINGGTITATGGSSRGAGIGGGGYMASNCGDITITGGTITANGGENSAGIGTGSFNENGGNITISGGTIVATGGASAAGIGTGWSGKCGTITITDGVTRVTASKGENSPCSIGKGKDSSTAASCGTITIGGTEYPDGISASPYIYDPNAPTYTVTVTGGTATPASSVAGSAVTITANAPEAGKFFEKWTTETTGVTFADETASSTSFTMPASAVTVTATYKDGIDLSTLTADTVIQDGYTVIGSTTAGKKIQIADGATVTLKGINIKCSTYKVNGIECLGTATLILEGTNKVETTKQDYAAIYAGPEGKTLTIRGDGSLTVKAYNYGAAIGSNTSGTVSGTVCGNITIEGGTIVATSGANAAAIGAGSKGQCGNIVISGGTVTANASAYNNQSSGAGIGTGSAKESQCGTITISGDNTKVTATRPTVDSSGQADCIGKGQGTWTLSQDQTSGWWTRPTCGTVTIGGVTGYKTEASYTYNPSGR